MFMAFEQTGQAIFEQLAWVCVRAPNDPKSCFVLSDHPVAHYDPTPKVPVAGRSFMSSPNSSTFIPLDPKFGLLLVRGRPQLSWGEPSSPPTTSTELNLLTYAWAQDAIYGPTQDSVTSVRSYARSHRQQLGEFAYAYRPPRIWVTEDDGNTRGTGPRTFISDFNSDRVSTRKTASGPVFRDTRFFPSYLGSCGLFLDFLIRNNSRPALSVPGELGHYSTLYSVILRFVDIDLSAESGHPVQGVTRAYRQVSGLTQAPERRWVQLERLSPWEVSPTTSSGCSKSYSARKPFVRPVFHGHSEMSA